MIDKKKFNENILSLVLYVFCIVYQLVNKRIWSNPDNLLLRHNIIFCYIAVLAVILLFTDAVKVNKVNARTVKNSNKIITIAFASVIIIVKFMLAFLVRTETPAMISIQEFLVYVIMYFISGFTEELMFDCLLYENLRKTRIPFVLCLAVVSLLFAFYHLEFKPLMFLGFFVFRLAMLLEYKNNPSLLLWGIFHALWNISNIITLL